MGGFQKYPVPRYMHISQWVINRQWKWNALHILVPASFLAYQVWRSSMLQTLRPPQYGEYVDPSSPVAPKAIQY